MRHVGAAQRSYDSSSYVELHSRSNKGDPHGLWGGVAFSPWIVPIEDGFVAPFRIDNIDNKQYGEPKPRLLGAPASVSLFPRRVGSLSLLVYRSEIRCERL